MVLRLLTIERIKKYFPTCPLLQLVGGVDKRLGTTCLREPVFSVVDSLLSNRLSVASRGVFISALPTASYTRPNSVQGLTGVQDRQYAYAVFRPVKFQDRLGRGGLRQEGTTWRRPVCFALARKIRLFHQLQGVHGGVVGAAHEIEVDVAFGVGLEPVKFLHVRLVAR